MNNRVGLYLVGTFLSFALLLATRITTLKFVGQMTDIDARRLSAREIQAMRTVASAHAR